MSERTGLKDKEGSKVDLTQEDTVVAITEGGNHSEEAITEGGNHSEEAITEGGNHSEVNIKDPIVKITENKETTETDPKDKADPKNKTDLNKGGIEREITTDSEQIDMTIIIKMIEEVK